MGVNLASFPNSRINPTPATSDAAQVTYSVPANTAALPLILPANANRTYLTIYNRDATNSIKFMNYQATSPVPTIAQILANGFELIAGAAYEIDTPEATALVSNAAVAVIMDTDQGSG